MHESCLNPSHSVVAKGDNPLERQLGNGLDFYTGPRGSIEQAEREINHTGMCGYGERGAASVIFVVRVDPC